MLPKDTRAEKSPGGHLPLCLHFTGKETMAQRENIRLTLISHNRVQVRNKSADALFPV